MDQNAFLRNLEKVFELKPGTLKGNERLSNIETWDSLAILGFIAMADKIYSATVKGEDVAGCKTVEDLAALLPNAP